MKFKLLTLTAACLLVLAGCGSDDDKIVEVIPPVEETQNPNVWGPEDRAFKLVDPITVFIDELPTFENWRDISEQRTPSSGLRIDPENIRKLRPQSLRDDVFVDGQITYADVMLYLSDTRNDFHVEYQWGEDIGGYRYTVYFDEGKAVKDSDGKLLEAYKGKGNHHWYASYLLPQGEFRTDALFYDNTGETFYRRLETTLVEHDSGIIFRPFSAAMTHRRESRMLREVAYMDNPKYQQLCAGKPKCIVMPHIEITPYDEDAEPEGSNGMLVNRGEMLHFYDVVVTPQNLRPDIYKKDSFITMADVLLSMDEQKLIDINFSYWGKLETNVNIEHYFVNEINGSRGGGAVGYLIDANEKAYKKDFAPKYSIWAVETMKKKADAGAIPFYAPMESYCDGLNKDGVMATVPDGVLDEHCADYYRELGLEVEVSDWYSKGAYHLFSDVWAMEYPMEWMEVRNGSMYGLFVSTDSEREGGDGKYPVHDIEEAKQALTAEHFGWGIADCGSCHSLEGIHSEGDVGTLGYNPHPVRIQDLIGGVRAYDVDDPIYGASAEVAPYQCAECHGSNGAPAGHGETVRCFWCHNNDFEPKKHGRLNQQYQNLFGEMFANIDAKLVGKSVNARDIIEVATDDLDAVRDASLAELGDAHYLEKILPATDKRPFVRYFGLYETSLKVHGNSDWSTDPIYPDPYSCLTCHKNP